MNFGDPDRAHFQYYYYYYYDDCFCYYYCSVCPCVKRLSGSQKARVMDKLLCGLWVFGEIFEKNAH